MFRQKTTLIVGAGASCELGLPSGDDLKAQIVSLLKPTDENAYGFSDPAMIAVIKASAGREATDRREKLAQTKEAAERIRRGLPLAPSIDNFLHSHQGDEALEQLGKLAIAITIARAEGESHLFRRVPAILRAQNPDAKPTLNIHSSALAKSWYPSFAQQLMSGVQRDNIASAFDNLRFIIFNYDRCLEHYIWKALQAYFDISEEFAAEILCEVSFIHPYGYLGPLPWRSKNDPVELGIASAEDVLRMASRIRTFTESVRSEVGRKVKESVEWADTLLILGFGYLDQNIQLLSCSSENRCERVFSTAYGVSQPDQLIMRDAMMTLGGVTSNSAMIEPGSCRDLFNNFRLHLSLR